MAAYGGTGLNAMVNGKSAYKQFMVRQGKDNYLRKIYTAKPTIDNRVPSTFKSKLQSNGRLPKEQQQRCRLRPQSGRETEMTSTHRQLALPVHQQQSSGDILETHRQKFTDAGDFTPRIKVRPGAVTQSRLLSSGLFVPVRHRKRPQSAGPSAASTGAARNAGGRASAQAEVKPRSRNACKFDETYDVIDGLVDQQIVGNNNSTAQPTQPQTNSELVDPMQQQRTADWLRNMPPEPNVYDSVFSKIDENYIEFAETIIKEISNSGVTSNRMINIIMRKQTEMCRGQLNIGKMEHVCKLIADYLNINDEPNEDEELERQVFQPSIKTPKSSQLHASNPIVKHNAPGAEEDKTITVTELTEVSQIDEDNRTATPLEDFHESLRAQLHDASELSATNADIEAEFGATKTSHDDRSVGEFNETLHPGQFEVMQTLQTGELAKQKTVRFTG